jgi:hypothetical protein
MEIMPEVRIERRQPRADHPNLRAAQVMLSGSGPRAERRFAIAAGGHVR